MTSFAILTPLAIMGPAALSTDTAGAPTLIVEQGARADVPVPQVALVVLHLARTHLMANVDMVMVTSFATPPVPFTRELVVPRMDGVATPMLTVGLVAKADVMAQPVELEAVLGVVLGQPLQLQRHLEPKNLCWARLQVHLQMAAILLTVVAALEMGTLFVVIGQTVVVVLSMG